MPREAPLEATWVPGSKMEVAASGPVFRQSASLLRGRKCVIGGGGLGTTLAGVFVRW